MSLMNPLDLKIKVNGGVGMKEINKKITEHAEHYEEEVAKMAWICEGMEHENCEEQEDGTWMCDGMEHTGCEKIEEMKYPKDEEDMSSQEDEENMSVDEDQEDMSVQDDEEEKMKKFMRTPYDEVQANVVKQFRDAMGDNMYIVQWSTFDDMIVFFNGEDGLYYRVDFIMDNETETLSFGEPAIVKLRYITDAEIDQLFPEQEDRGGQVQNATESSADGENTPEQKGVLLTESEAEQFKKDMAELQVFRKADKLKLAATFQELVDKEIYNSILESIDSLTKEQLETKLSVEAMKRIKAEKESQKTQTINPVKFYTGATNTHTNQNPVASLIDQWKDKK